MHFITSCSVMMPFATLANPRESCHGARDAPYPGTAPEHSSENERLPTDEHAPTSGREAYYGQSWVKMASLPASSPGVRCTDHPDRSCARGRVGQFCDDEPGQKAPSLRSLERADRVDQSPRARNHPSHSSQLPVRADYGGCGQLTRSGTCRYARGRHRQRLVRSVLNLQQDENKARMSLPPCDG